jgi:hypothetical protein
MVDGISNWMGGMNLNKLFIRVCILDMIPSLDLFSGIGGFAYALRDIAQPVAYCEIDPFCRGILHHNIDRGDLHDAQIFEDVRTIDSGSFYGVKPRLLTAGFPCQDISNANNHRKGLSGRRSSLYFEIVRLIDAIDTLDTIILENVPNIVRSGLDRICDTLIERGFETRWGVFGAYECGMQHRRLRWFMLAYKNDLPVEFRYITIVPDTPEVVDRIVPICDVDKQANCKSLRALGNAVVPAQVRFALKTLTQVDGCNLRACRKFPKKSHTKWIYVRNREGLFRIKRYPRRIGDELSLQIGDIVRLSMWPTPVSTRLNQFRNPTYCQAQLFANAVYYEQNTLMEARRRVGEDLQPNMIDTRFRINPQFVSALMGYPIAWIP